MTKTIHKLKVPLEYKSKIITKSAGDRIYKDVILLTAGEWTDSVTRSPVKYTETVLKKYAKNWISNFLNLDHSFETLNRIGWVENNYYSKGKLMGDIRISTDVPNGKAAVAHIDAGLVNGLSVEVASEDKWDPKENIRLADELDFMGCAVTTYPADENTRIK